MEVLNKFLANSYNEDEDKKVPIIMSWLGHLRLHFIQTLTDNE